MKILLDSDEHHFAWPAFASPRERGLTSRIAEGLRAEDQLTALIQEHGVDLHIRCGDLLDRKDIFNAIVYNEVYARMAERRVETLLLHGNHDEAAGGVRSSLDAFGHMKHVTVVDTPRVIDPVSGVLISCVPYAAPAIQEAMWRWLEPRSTDFNLLVAHTEVVGAQVGSEFRLRKTFTLDEIGVDRFDLCLFGHIHRPQQLAPNTHYVGPLLQRTFADAGAQCRVLLVDTDTGDLTTIPLTGPRFLTTDLQVSAPDFDTDPDGWAALFTTTEDSPLYLHVRVADPRVTRRQVEDALDGHVAGLNVSRLETALPEQTQALVDQTRGGWATVIEDWTRAVDTPLDRTRLAALGIELLEEAAQVK